MSTNVRGKDPDGKVHFVPLHTHMPLCGEYRDRLADTTETFDPVSCTNCLESIEDMVLQFLNLHPYMQTLQHIRSR